jgi:hypothetical protein
MLLLLVENINLMKRVMRNTKKGNLEANSIIKKQCELLTFGNVNARINYENDNRYHRK